MDGIEGEPETMRKDLVDLVLRWTVASSPWNDDAPAAAATPLACGLVDPAEVEVPAALAVTITFHEPWRAQALEDARTFLASRVFFGIGMEVLLPDELRTEAFGVWPACVTPLRYRVTWNRDMSGETVDSFDGTLQRVGLEEGSWKIVEFWTGEEREASRRTLEIVRGMRAERAAKRREPLLDRILLRLGLTRE